MTTVELVTKVANTVVKQQYPLLGDSHFNTYDVAVVLYSYIEIVENWGALKVEAIEE